MRTTRYSIRETSCKCGTPLYFYSFARGGGVAMCFGPDQAQKYDNMVVATNILIQVKERTGRNDWVIEPRIKGM